MVWEVAALENLSRNVMDHHYMPAPPGSSEGLKTNIIAAAVAPNGFSLYTLYQVAYGDKRDSPRGYVVYQGSYASRDNWNRRCSQH